MDATSEPLKASSKLWTAFNITTVFVGGVVDASSPSELTSYNGHLYFLTISFMMVSTSLHSLFEGVCHDWNASQSSNPQTSAYFSLKNRFTSSRLIWRIDTKSPLAALFVIAPGCPARDETPRFGRREAVR